METVIGIDEVGRGPIAGPVAVGAFVFRIPMTTRKLLNIGLPIRDSKKLTKAQREKWYVVLSAWKKEGVCDFYVCMKNAKEIDVKGISVCIKGALKTSLGKLQADPSCKIILDAGLKAPAEFKDQQSFVKGDEKYPVISFASIVAKVTRDGYMEKIGKKYPGYGFERHVGYGTKAHYAAIKRSGKLTIHRKSFLRD